MRNMVRLLLGTFGCSGTEDILKQYYMQKDLLTIRRLPYEVPMTQSFEFSLEGVIAQSGNTEQFLPGGKYGEGDFIF